MRDLAHTSGATRIGLRALAVLGTIGAITGLAVAQTATATAATKALPPTIASSFTPGLIGVGQTTSVAYTITDPNATGSLSNVAFNGTLAGAVVDNPNGLNTSGCGTTVTVTANPGDTNIIVGGIVIKAGTPCVLSLAVTSQAAGTGTSTVPFVASSAGNGTAGSTASLTVVPDPTVTATAPTEGATYTYGQQVTVTYTCDQADIASGIEGCSAQDDLGNDVASGGLLDTTAPGVHQLTIQAFSVTGAETDDTIDYTVLPDNVFKLKGVSTAGGKLSFKLALPGPGKVTVKVLSGSKTFATATVKVNGKKTITVHPTRTTAGSKLLAAGAVKLKLKITYTPKGGVAKTIKHGGIKLS